MTRLAFLSLLVCALACGDDDDTVTDDPTEDASVADGGSSQEDGGSEATDAGSDPDGGPGPVDAAPPTDDAGELPDLGTAPCDGLLLGTPCRDSCSRGFECVEGVCLPGSMRAGCGGFAGAMCTTRAFPNCATYSGSDYGPCLSEEEMACACSALTDIFACPGRE